MKNLAFLAGLSSKKVADILNFWWIKYFDKSLSYLKNEVIGVLNCWNYRHSKLLLHFIEYHLDQLNNKHTKTAAKSAVQFFENPYQKKISN